MVSEFIGESTFDCDLFEIEVLGFVIIEAHLEIEIVSLKPCLVFGYVVIEFIKRFVFGLGFVLIGDCKFVKLGFQ